MEDLPAERLSSSRIESARLAERLFVPAERWGWEYVEPVPAATPAALQERPVWHEPSISRPFPVRAPVRAKQSRPQSGQVGWRLAVFIPVTLICLLAAAWAAGLLVIPVLLGLVLFAPMIFAAGGRPAPISAEVLRQEEWAKHQQAVRQWEAEVARHEQAEKERRAAALVWYPLQAHSGAHRVDIVGGTGDGWASLLATFGSSVLAEEEGVLLLDFSEHDVGGGLAELAAGHGVSAERLHLPAGLAELDLLGGLDREECAEVLAEAVGTLRPVAANANVRAMHAAFLRAVTVRLDGPLTFTRIAAGLRVLQRRYDDIGEAPILTPGEVRALTSHVDIVGTSELAQTELGFLCDMLELLAYERADERRAETGEWWRLARVTVITTDDLNERRRDLTDRILIQVILQHLRRRRFGDSHGMLVIAGADHLGARSLESLTRHSRLNGARLVLLFEHLRDDAVQLLGGGASAAIIMRLGNAQEAAAAAEFIGRSHKFVQSQLTRQVGETKTVTTGVTGGGQSGLSMTAGQGWGHNSGPGGGSRHSSSHSSVTDSRMQTWSETKNWSVAASVTQGETDQRVYEFTIEPTEIQALAPTAFVLVDSSTSGRRVVLGDCNPGIVTLDRVSATPRGG